LPGDDALDRGQRRPQTAFPKERAGNSDVIISGASLLRGIPWITALLLRNMPERAAPPAFERTWITLLLTAQVLLGGLLGIVAQGFLAYASSPISSSSGCRGRPRPICWISRATWQRPICRRR
jgi:hypothetical protein